MKKRTRREFLATTGAAVSAGALAFRVRPTDAASEAGTERRPNVILVMTDDQGYGDLGCHGNKIIRTPNLNQFYRQCTRLTNFHVDPTCSPTRSALLTGHYSSRTGVWHTIMGRSLLHRDETTVADVFAANGYRTAAFGKWHLGDNYPFRPQDRGFQETLVHGGGGVGQTPDFWGNDYFDDTYWHNGKTKKYQGYCTDVWFDGALDFIERNKDRPFFCYIPTNAPHGPYNVDEKYSKPYEEMGVPRNRARFWGMITNIDENMGRLLDKLKEWDLEENTIVIFMTDNGTSGGDFNDGMRGKKGSEYDGGHRVPFFIRWPGKLAAGRDIARLTAHVDVLPTLIDLCGLKKPKNPDFDGTSLVPLLKGEVQDWPDRTLVVHSQRIEHPEKWRKSAVMTDRWRLINGKELYDMKADPGQKTDVAETQPAVVAKLRDEYEEWWKHISGRFGGYCEIVIGSEHENPARLTAHDWHGRSVPWNQGSIRNSKGYPNGFWAIDVARGGKYEFTLRRWPQEEDKPIEANRARLKIGRADVTQSIPKGATEAKFEVNLEAGPTRLETWLTDDEKGRTRGAYFVYVKRL